MKWTSTLHSSSSLERAVRQAARDVKSHLNSNEVDLGLLFVSSAYRSEMVDLWPSLRKEIHINHLIGCTAGGVIGGGHEVEDQPAVSLTAATLPGVTISVFHVQQESLPSPDSSPRAWRELVNSPIGENPHFILLAEPFSLDVDSLIHGLDYAYPQSVKVGGLASGGMAPQENLLFNGEKILSKGAVGISLTGNILIESVVAQGCRPIGEPLSITESDGNVMVSVDNQAPLEYLQRLYEKLSPRDQELLQTSLFVGILMDPFKKEPKQGDFLIRNIVGIDQHKGLLAVGAPIRSGQTIQFHLRDANTSHEDLQTMLRQSSTSKGKTAKTAKSSHAGAMLFSCLGRGRRLYGEPDHDSTVFKSIVGDIPLGGFFCNGEIGPVGGRTYLHGYTSSIAVFSKKNGQ